MGAVKSKLAWKRFAGRGGTAGGAPAGGEKQLVAETQTMLKWLKKKRKAKGITVLGGGTCTAVRAVVDGEVRVFKVRYSAAQVENEQRANALYARFGAAVPEVRVERIDGAEGVACMSQRYIEGTSLLALELQREKFEAGGDAASAAGVKAHLRAAHDALGEHFLLDCVFGNWDVIGARGRTGGDNVLVGKDGRPYRIDNAGVFAVRAQGDPKNVEDWSTQAPFLPELFHMRDPCANPAAGRVFARVSDGALAAQYVAAEQLWAADPTLFDVLPEADGDVVRRRFACVREAIAQGDLSCTPF